MSSIGQSPILNLFQINKHTKQTNPWKIYKKKVEWICFAHNNKTAKSKLSKDNLDNLLKAILFELIVIIILSFLLYKFLLERFE